jgi:exopolysaccharide biosynthesis polyprenyl glycosylphosphotransferase
MESAVPGWLSWLSIPPGGADSVSAPSFREIAWIPFVAFPVTVASIWVLGGYRHLLKQSRIRVLASAIAPPVTGIVVIGAGLFAIRDQSASRGVIFSFGLLSALGLLTVRSLLFAYKRRRLLSGYYTHNVLLVASAGARTALQDHLESRTVARLYRIVGHLDPSGAAKIAPSGSNSGDSHEGGTPCMGSVADLGELLVHRPIHEVLVALSEENASWLPMIIEQCDYFKTTLRLVPEVLLFSKSTDLQLRFNNPPLRLPEIVLRPRLLDEDALFIKRVFDIIVAATLLIGLSPLLILIAIGIKLTTPRLPIFYPWRVIGYKGRPFTGYKFTTMEQDADRRKTELMHLNEMTGPVFKIKRDPRVTRLGRYLRKYSLNELPQLWSVLTGDMSLVGPRPAGPTELERYNLWQKRKLCVQPGITCLWQIRGRNSISNFDDWVRLDFEYIDNWSLWLDCRILVRTVWVVISGSGT